MRTDVEVPAAVRAAARRAFALRERDARVLDLLTDSLVDDPSHEGPRELRFLDVSEGADVTVLVHQLADPGRIALDVVVAPVSAAVVEVRDDEGRGTLQEVCPGWWCTGPLRHGLASLLVVVSGERLRTAWVRI